MVHIDSKKGRFALCIGHVAGMVDIVALPVWVGALISEYAFSPQRAGGLATLFLLGVVAASLFFAPRINRLPVKSLALVGYSLAALCFFALSQTNNYTNMAVIHAIGGLSVGCGLSVVHGTMGKSKNPHGIFAMAQFSLAIFAVLFLGAMPLVIQSFGGSSLFVIIAILMLLAAVVVAVVFPSQPLEENLFSSKGEEGDSQKKSKIPRGVWFGIIGVSLLALNQAMIFSFVERMAADREFRVDQISIMLLCVGIINIFSAVFAAALQKRWSAHLVLLGGPIAQGILAIIITQSSDFTPYVVAACFFPFIMIFSHTFAFGLFARRDPTGRAVAATPAMNMTGAAIGPFLGGTLVQYFGYQTLGYIAVVIGLVAVICFYKIGKSVTDIPLNKQKTI